MQSENLCSIDIHPVSESDGISKCLEIEILEDLDSMTSFDEMFEEDIVSPVYASTPSPVYASTPSPVYARTPSPSVFTPVSYSSDEDILHPPHVLPATIEATANTKTQTEERCTTTISQPKRSRALAKAKKISTNRVVNILPKPGPALATAPAPVCPPTAPTCATFPVLIIPPLMAQKTGSPVILGQPIGWGPLLMNQTLQKPQDTPQAMVPTLKKRSRKKNASQVELSSEDLERQERSNAAAKRHRIRLKESQEKQHQRNIELEAENLRLRTELAALKKAHCNCSVTVPQEQTTTQTLDENDGATVMDVDQASPVALAAPQMRLFHVTPKMNFAAAPVTTTTATTIQRLETGGKQIRLIVGNPNTKRDDQKPPVVLSANQVRLIPATPEMRLATSQGQTAIETQETGGKQVRLIVGGQNMAKIAPKPPIALSTAPVRLIPVTPEMKVTGSTLQTILQTHGTVTGGTQPTSNNQLVVDGLSLKRAVEQPPVALSAPQVCRIAPRIVNSQVTKKNPIFVVISPGVKPPVPSAARAESNVEIKSVF
ncbi:uncharacterized protein LOC131210562 [Anopheles bellator]|uniref:uncharacterized protein LOC131210562 n=1 Tax=Anopheles bellator TaxID=139047 RepID=UPI002647EB06|nr:uncharacterized protein LOC131210562 [Anopheles bellator]